MKPKVPLFPGLKTKRLELIQIGNQHKEDLEELFPYSSSNLRSADELLEMIKRDYENGESINWGLKLNDTIIGTCGFYRGFANEIGEIGFVLRKQYRGNEYMLEAANAIINYGFNVLQLKLITAYTKDENTSARVLLKKLNFIPTDELFQEYRIYHLNP